MKRLIPISPVVAAFYATTTVSWTAVVSIGVLCTVGSAQANLLLTQIYTVWPPTTAPRILTLSDGPGLVAEVNFGSAVGTTLVFGSHDSPETTQLTQTLTNGILDTLTFGLNGQTFQRPENFFSTSGLDDPRHFSGLPWPSGIDYSGLRIDQYQILLSQADSTGTQVTWSVYGGVPEPSSWLLALIGSVSLLQWRERLG
jgi:hypothetical protein